MLNLERDSLIFISPDELLRRRFMQACEFILYKPVIFESLDLFLADEKVKPHTVLLDCGATLDVMKDKLKKLNEQFQDEADLVVICEINDQTLKTSQELFITHLLDRTLFMETFMTEFLVFQKGLCNFYEISPQDLFPDTTIPFNAFHYLPLNQKYVAIVNENLTMTEVKFKKLEATKILYIHRENVTAYNQYIEYYFDRFNFGLKKRLRAKFYQIFAHWREALVIGLVSSPRPNFFPGSLDDISDQLKLVNEYLREAPDPWQLLFEISQLPILQYDRSALELVVSSCLADHYGDLNLERLIELKWALACSHQMTPALYFKKRIFDHTPMKADDLKVQQAFVAQMPVELSEDLKKDFQNYGHGFIAKTTPPDLQPFYCEVYMGEKVVESFTESGKNHYARMDLLQGALARVKSENLLNEAWLESFRLLFAKGNLSEPKKGNSTP